jgi:magnesium transporter
VISHRQNNVLLLLTVISATMLPLTLITGIFGMNVLYPGEGTHNAFWVILAALVVALGGMLGFFRWKRWL